MQLCRQLWRRVRQYQAQSRAERDRRLAAQRRLRLAAQRRRLMLASCGPLERARLERREQARRRRRYDRYRGCQGVFINLNAHMRGQEGGIGKLAIFLLLAFICVVMFTLMVPIMLIAGAVELFATKLFGLPGMKLLCGALISLLCGKLTDAVLKLLDKGGGPFRWVKDRFEDITDFAASKIKGLVGNTIANLVMFPFHSVLTIADVIQQGVKIAEEFRIVVCGIFGKKGLIASFEDRGGKTVMRASLDCANWPADQLGPLSSEGYKTVLDATPNGSKITGTNSKDGKPQFCIDGDRETSSQGLVPEWLRPIYQQAADRYDLPWQLLAAINWNDTEYGAKVMNKDQKKKKIDIDYSDALHGMSTLLNPIWGAVAKSKFETVRKMFPGIKKDELKDAMRDIITAATDVSAEWQMVNPRIHDRAGWIPMDLKEWESVEGDHGGVPMDWNSSPYPDADVDGAPQPCPNPIDTAGNNAAGGAGAGGPVVYDGKHKAPKVDWRSMPKWPGDKAPEKERAQWVARIALKYKVPPVILVTAGLQESGLQAFLPPNSMGAAGIFQMLKRFFETPSSKYRGYTTEPRKQIWWAIDKYYYLINHGIPPKKDEKGWGHWIASHLEVAQLPSQHGLDGHYQKRIPHAKELVKGMSGASSTAEVAVEFEPDGDTDTCDPVDSIFGLAEWLSKRGAAGEIWHAALEEKLGKIGDVEELPGKINEKVFVEGDSLTVIARDDIKKEFDDKLQGIDAKSSRQVTTGIEHLRAREDNLPGIVVFALGANSWANTEKAKKGWIGQVMKIAGKDRCVVWPTVYADGPRWVDLLLSAKKRYDNLVVPRWDQMAPSYVGHDRVHFAGAEGTKAYAKMMRDGAGDCGSAVSAGDNKTSKITGKKGELLVQRNPDLTIAAGATTYGGVYRNRPGEIPRKGALKAIDPDDNNEPTCDDAGSWKKYGGKGNHKLASNRYPGVAIKVGNSWPKDSEPTLCGYWQITAPNGKSMIVMQSDSGPGANGVYIDVNATLAQELGYPTGGDNFPSLSGVWTGTYLGKKRPSNVNQLLTGRAAVEPRTKALKLKTKPPAEFRASAVPPLAELKKPNKDLPTDKGWVHAPAGNLTEPFPSFNSGLPGRVQSGACGPTVAKSQMGIFYSAGKAFHVPWQLLAAYAAVGSGYGCRGGQYSEYAGRFSTDANGDGKVDPTNATDATFSTARSLYALGGDKNPGKAARALTKDRKDLAQIAAIARSLGYNTNGMTKLMDDLISRAVQDRDHIINRRLCAGIKIYVECIASLYRKIVGEEETPEAGKWLTGGCNPPPVPDTNLKPYSLTRYASKPSSKAYFKIPAQEKGAMVVTTRTWARRDAYAGAMAAIRTFLACYPKYKKNWKVNNRWGDWGAGDVKASWAFPGSPGTHRTHRNGADVDIDFDGPTNMETWNGRPYSRKHAKYMMRMFLRAGAFQVIFEDPKVRDSVTRAREEFGRKHPDVVRKLKDHWIMPPNYDTNDGMHHDHFHVHWYVKKGKNPVPAKVKVWLTDEARSGESSDNSDDTDPNGDGGGGGGDKSGSPYDGGKGGKNKSGKDCDAKIPHPHPNCDSLPPNGGSEYWAKKQGPLYGWCFFHFRNNVQAAREQVKAATCNVYPIDYDIPNWTPRAKQVMLQSGCSRASLQKDSVCSRAMGRLIRRQIAFYNAHKGDNNRGVSTGEVKRLPLSPY